MGCFFPFILNVLDVVYRRDNIDFCMQRHWEESFILRTCSVSVSAKTLLYYTTVTLQSLGQRHMCFLHHFASTIYPAIYIHKYFTYVYMFVNVSCGIWRPLYASMWLYKIVARALHKDKPSVLNVSSSPQKFLMRLEQGETRWPLLTLLLQNNFEPTKTGTVPTLASNIIGISKNTMQR